MVDRLPEPVLLKVFSRLMLVDLGRAACVCQQWQRIAYDASLWRKTDLCGASLSEESFHLFINRISAIVSEMNLGGCTIPLSVICEISKKCNQLRSLSLQGCKITGLTANCDLVTHLGREAFSSLRALDLRFMSSEESKAFTKLLPYLSSTRTLAIDNTSSTATFTATVLSSMSQLRILHCQNCSSFADSDVQLLGKNCRNLESLCLTGCIAITGSSFPELFAGCKQLKTLLLSCTRLRNEHLLKTNWGKTSLTELDISYCYGIATSALLQMLPALTDLRYLQVSFCGWGRALNDSVITEMARRDYNELEVLDIHSSFNLSGGALHSLLVRCKMISTFCVGSVINTFEELDSVLSCLPNLKNFYITKQSAIKTELVFDRVMTYCPRIEILALYNFYAISRNQVEDALVELVRTCKHLRVLCIRGTNVPLRTELAAMATKVKNAANQHKIQIVRRPHYFPCGALLSVDNQWHECSNQ